MSFLSRLLGTDPTTHAAKTIEYEHSEIHSGSHYMVCGYSEGLADEAEIEFVITTPDTTTWLHMDFSIYSSNGAKMDVYEGATTVAGGTPVTPINNNRNSSNTTGSTLVVDPASIGGDGDLIGGFLAGAGREAGFFNRDREIVLKQNTTYLFRITTTAGTNNVSWCGEWYEHTNKEL